MTLVDVKINSKVVHYLDTTDYREKYSYFYMLISNDSKNFSSIEFYPLSSVCKIWKWNRNFRRNYDLLLKDNRHTLSYIY